MPLHLCQKPPGRNYLCLFLDFFYVAIPSAVINTLSWLITVAVELVLKLSGVIFPALFFFYKIMLAIISSFAIQCKF